MTSSQCLLPPQVEEQCYVAKFYLRQPHGKAKAMRTLERVSRVCAEYTGAVTPPVALALVKLRLNVAAVSSRCGKHDMALHEAQVALREADGVAQALDMVGHGGYGAADTAVLACLAQQAIAAELAHLGAPEMSAPASERERCVRCDTCFLGLRAASR